MVVNLRDNYRGRKMKKGTVCFTEKGQIAFFIDYCPGCCGKLLMTPSECREFAKRFGSDKKLNIIKRVVVRLASSWATA